MAVGAGLVMCVLGAVGAMGQPGGGAAEKKDDAKPKPTPSGSGVAVVELFSSEGCDSCPPADDLAAKISREAREKGRSVFVLAMHVDYWDYLGWKDPFARHEFAERQRTYAGAFGKAGGDSSVYTPQMVVNGTAGFNGANEKSANRAIDRALADAGRVKIEASVAARKPGEPVKVRAQVSGDARWIDVAFAVVEDGLSSAVKAGENKGKTLRHDRVVRAFAKKSVKGGVAEVELKLPVGVNEANCRVVVFGQDEKTLAVQGAAEVGLAESKAESPAK